jgi:protein-serine/threonine kinase
LVCDAEKRITELEIPQHPFFHGVPWQTLRQLTAPFVPQLKSITDTSYFPIDELNQIPDDIPAAIGVAPLNDAMESAFVGYTFKRWHGA